MQNSDQKPKGKRPLGMFKRRWQRNIDMDLQEIAWEYAK